MSLKTSEINYYYGLIRKSIKEWDDMNENEKESYLEEYHEDRQNYLAKKLQYFLDIKNKGNKPRTAFNIFTEDILNFYSEEDYKHVEFFDYVYQRWREIDSCLKIVYEDRAEERKLEFMEKVEILKLKKSKLYYKNPYDIESQIGNLSTQESFK
jgi:hypothetical protein